MREDIDTRLQYKEFEEYQQRLVETLLYDVGAECPECSQPAESWFFMEREEKEKVRWIKICCTNHCVAYDFKQALKDYNHDEELEDLMNVYKAMVKGKQQVNTSASMKRPRLSNERKNNKYDDNDSTNTNDSNKSNNNNNNNDNNIMERELMELKLRIMVLEKENKELKARNKELIDKDTDNNYNNNGNDNNKQRDQYIYNNRVKQNSDKSRKDTKATPRKTYAQAARNNNDENITEVEKDNIVKQLTSNNIIPQIFHRRYLKWNLPRKYRDQRNNNANIKLANKLLTYLDIKTKTKEISLVGNSLIELYIPEICLKEVEHVCELRQIKLEKIDDRIHKNITNRTEEELNEMIVRRIGYLLTRNNITNMRNAILENYPPVLVERCLQKEKELRGNKN